MPGTPTSSRDAQAGAPVLPGELPYSSTPPGPGAASTTAPAPAAPGVLPPSLSMGGAFPSAPASFGTYPYSAGGQVYFPMYGQGLPSAPLSSGSMGAAYAPPLPAGMPMVGMRPPGYGASYVDDRRSHPDPAPAPRHAHDRAYPRSYAPRHAARPGAAAGAAASAGAVAVPGPGTNTGAGTGASVGPGLAPGAVLGVDEIPRVSPLPALPQHSRDGPAPEFVPGGSSGQLTPHVARLQAQAPRFTPSPSRGLRSESSARDASVPEAPVSTYVHSRLPPLEPLPSGPGAVRDEELQQLPEGVKAYISGLESLVATYKKRENEHALRLEALAFNPVLALRQGPKNDVSVVTQAEESEAGTEGKIKTTTTPEAMAESKTKTETGLDQAADPELHPAPILGLRLLHRVQELTEENEELGRTLEKRLFPVADSVQTDPEEFESMRADLEDAHTLLEHLDAAVAAANERTKQMEDALHSVCNMNSVGIADSLGHLHLSDPSSSGSSTMNATATSSFNSGANAVRGSSPSSRPRREERGQRSGGRRPPGQGQGQGQGHGQGGQGQKASRCASRSGAPRSSGRTASEGKSWRGHGGNK